MSSFMISICIVLITCNVKLMLFTAYFKKQWNLLEQMDYFKLFFRKE